MKKNLLKFYVLTFVLFSDFVIFAQGPGNDSEDGDLEGGDDLPAAPINTKLIWLAIVGVLFVLYTYRKSRKVA
ncbi:MAG: hypothetical protein ITG00_08020 [Flavobacterium sp.]|nr:hypothetical protein [Flavobacterium sp.]